MAFTIIQDAEKAIAALIDPELGRALGPIALGEHAVELLDKFASAHGVDPATIPTPELETRWKDFVTSLSGEVAKADGEGVTAGDVVVAGGSQPHAGAEPAPIEPAAEQVAPTGEPAPAEQATATTQDAPPPAGEQAGTPALVTPVTEAKPGNVVCPTCNGWREVVQGSATVTCPTCKGEGEVPVDQPATGQQPAA